MAKSFRVIAHAMQESELSAAEGIITDPARTEAFVTGVADEQAIERLKDAGVIVETVSELDASGRPVNLVPETPGSGAAPIQGGALRSIVIGRSALNVDESVDLNKPQYYLIQIAGPLILDYK